MKSALVLGGTSLVIALGGCAVPTTQSVPSDIPNPPPATAPVQPAPKPETQAPEVPSLTVSQQNAVESAESYLQSQAFSKKGLIEQLQYEKFSKADATFAANHITVDWNAQAAASAKEYLQSSSFSSDGLYEQLKYEGFTDSQAKYGVRAVGL